MSWVVGCSLADCALTQQMIGCIKAISPCVKSASAKLFLDLYTVLAPSGEQRTLDTSAQVERAGAQRPNSLPYMFALDALVGKTKRSKAFKSKSEPEVIL